MQLQIYFVFVTVPLYLRMVTRRTAKLISAKSDCISIKEMLCNVFTCYDIVQCKMYFEM